jgi:hypothetical protein
VFTVTADPTVAFADAIYAALTADTGTSGLMTLVTGVYGHLSEAARTAYPYVVLGRTTRTGDAGAMQIAGSRVTLQIDTWSDAKGPYDASRIVSRVYALLERRRLAVQGFTAVDGSLTCEYTEIFDEPDEDKPGSRLYHGVQRWVAEIHESQ